MSRIDFDRIAADYDRGRAVALEGLEGWRRALAMHLPPRSGLPVLDVGSGTGHFAEALASWFDGDVVGVEPSAGMLAEARRKPPHPRIRYMEGRAEELPLADASAGAAWLSTVVHHFGDLGRAAAEIGRVLDPAGKVLIRSAFPGRPDNVTLFRFFPTARAIVDTYPSVERVEQAFAAAGFHIASLETVFQVTAPSLSVFLDRVRTRADTTLRRISDSDYEAGLAAISAVISAEQEPKPVVDGLDLLVLERRV